MKGPDDETIVFCRPLKILLLFIIIITFILIQGKGFTESLLNWKTSTSPNSAQLTFLYVITETLETVNVNLSVCKRKKEKKNKAHHDVDRLPFYGN